MRFMISFGVLLWLAATIMFRWFGNILVDPGSPWIWLSFILIVPVVLFLQRWLFISRQIPPGSRPRAAILTALPGMLLDLFSVSFHSVVFPSLPASLLPVFFVWLLWAYSVILLGGLLWSRQGSDRKRANS